MSYAYAKKDPMQRRIERRTAVQLAPKDEPAYRGRRRQPYPLPFWARKAMALLERGEPRDGWWLRWLLTEDADAVGFVIWLWDRRPEQ